jgi:Flp pilus assembly protein TadB
MGITERTAPLNVDEDVVGDLVEGQRLLVEAAPQHGSLGLPRRKRRSLKKRRKSVSGFQFWQRRPERTSSPHASKFDFSPSLIFFFFVFAGVKTVNWLYSRLRIVLSGVLFSHLFAYWVGAVVQRFW